MKIDQFIGFLLLIILASTLSIPCAANALGTPTPTDNPTHIISVATRPSITTSSLPSGVAGNTYNASLGATGGRTPYTWSITSGALPGGLVLSPGGVISGTPTRSGTFGFTVMVRDSSGPAQTASRTLSITIKPRITATISDLQSKAVDLALALELMGAPYLGDGKTWGGKGWDWVKKRWAEPSEIKNGYYYYDNRTGKIELGKGIDCSGLVLWAYGKAAGWVYSVALDKIGENASQQRAKCLIISKGDLRGGDLVFFQGHVAMYVGGGYVIHSAGNKGVVKEPLDNLKPPAYVLIGYGRPKLN